MQRVASEMNSKSSQATLPIGSIACWVYNHRGVQKKEAFFAREGEYLSGGIHRIISPVLVSWFAFKA